MILEVYGRYFGLQENPIEIQKWVMKWGIKASGQNSIGSISILTASTDRLDMAATYIH